MITFQVNTHFSQALPCTREEFWEQVKKSSTRWKIDMRRAIMAAVEASKTEGAVALHNLLQNSDYQKFLLKKQGMKKKAAKEAWEKKTDAEKLLAFAQEVKDNLPAFIFACREFDETETAKGGMFRHRRLADCHLNGLFMLDIDHIENPMDVWYKMRDDEELMKSIALVHITSSEHGVRIVSVADMNIGNLADNQIALAQKLGYKADESCIDAETLSLLRRKTLFILMRNFYLITTVMHLTRSTQMSTVRRELNHYFISLILMLRKRQVPVIKRQLRQHLMATCRHRQKFCLKKSCLCCQSCRQKRTQICRQ